MMRRRYGPSWMQRCFNGFTRLSTDLLHAIIEEDISAKEAWDWLRNLFQDNKNSRAVALEHDFSHVKIRDFPNASAYCQQLKTLSGQLKSVGGPVIENRLVLQLVAGLTEAYKNLGTNIRQSKPLPPFTEACSSLRLEEKALAEIDDEAPAAMVVDHHDFDEPPLNQNTGNCNNHRGKHNH
ncbi:uncharacterized protein [Spinacia oleracea]|uniref:Uncharacterized protein n=1 Tax=Spinacia oleracea TaxID=3562 RepID=A0A9R0J4M0_SPIOL|nr:uncharacterized protein LOC110800147 [Spinacia oleracea]